jgi:hypothetical protein
MPARGAMLCWRVILEISLAKAILGARQFDNTRCLAQEIESLEHQAKSFDRRSHHIGQKGLTTPQDHLLDCIRIREESYCPDNLPRDGTVEMTKVRQ